MRSSSLSNNDIWISCMYVCCCFINESPRRVFRKGVIAGLVTDLLLTFIWTSANIPASLVLLLYPFLHLLVLFIRLPPLPSILERCSPHSLLSRSFSPPPSAVSPLSTPTTPPKSALYVLLVVPLTFSCTQCCFQCQDLSYAWVSSAVWPIDAVIVDPEHPCDDPL